MRNEVYLIIKCISQRQLKKVRKQVSHSGLYLFGLIDMQCPQGEQFHLKLHSLIKAASAPTRRVHRWFREKKSDSYFWAETWTYMFSWVTIRRCQSNKIQDLWVRYKMIWQSCLLYMSKPFIDVIQALNSHQQKKLNPDLRIPSVHCGLSTAANTSFSPEPCRLLLPRSNSLRLEDLKLTTEDSVSQLLCDRLQPLSLKMNMTSKTWNTCV